MSNTVLPPRLTPEDVVREYLEGLRRRSCPPSLAGRDTDMPAATAPPSGRWESLVLLVHGIPSLALDVLWLRQFGQSGVTYEERALPVRFATVEEWEQADPETRGPLVGIPHQVAVGLTWREIASAMGMKPAEVRRLVNDALSVVSERLARWRSLEV